MTKGILDTIKSWGFFVIFLFQATVCPGSNLQPAGARSLAMSHAYVSFSDIWSAFHNQAGLAGVQQPAGCVYFESRFGIDELSLVAGSVILPAGNGAFAISTSQFGKGTFRESKYALAYAHQLAEKWHAGLQIDYCSQTLPENDHARGFATFEGGVIFIPSERLHLGVHVFNAVSGGFETPSGRQQIPPVIRAGGNYSFDKTVLLAFEVEKHNHEPMVVKSGIEFLPVGNFALRLGVSGKPVNYTAGFGYNTGRFSTDIGFAYHGNLGLTPAISVQFSL